jgi:hypothetical protein
MEHVDLLVIGAGWHGLAMGKTYHQAFPEKKLVVADSAASIGGVWAAERCYPGLKTNNIVGSYEFSDFPMSLPRYNMKPGQHIPGKIVHQYLVDFATQFDLIPSIHLRTKVFSSNLGDDGKWVVECTVTSNAVLEDGTPELTNKTYIAERVVVATGVASRPQMPRLPGRETYKGRVYHAVEMESRAKELESAKNHIIVIGANKSAWDACYLAATRAAPGATVHMIIRSSGRGPSWLFRNRAPIDKLSISKLSSTRLFSLFDPTPLHTPWTRFFQNTWAGQFFSKLFWRMLDQRVLAAAGHKTSKLGRGGQALDGGLGALRPWYSTFWMGNSLSVHNYPTDWYELVQTGRVVVHHAEIDNLIEDNNTVKLSDGTTLQQVDAIITCTGWTSRPDIEFGPASLKQDLNATGMGDHILDESVADATAPLVAEARKAIEATYPRLISPEKPGAKKREPCRLYRFMVPLHGKSLELSNLAFMGFQQSIQTVLVAQAQALWLTAYFDKSLTQQPNDLDACRRWTYLHTEYQRMRHLGSPHPDLVIESIPYIDLLLSDVGISTSRKGSWWKDLVEQLTPGDYRGMVQQWAQKKLIAV